MIRNLKITGSLAGLALLASSLSSEAQLKPEDIYSKVAPSVVTLEVENVAGKHFVGSAFLAERDGLAVTAWHVVHDAKRVQARFADNQRAEVTGVVDKNEKLDLAVLEIPSVHRPSVTLATAAPRIGSRIYLVGSPRGLDFSISEGLVGQTRTLDGIRYYQLSCPISPGDSGSPVLNDRGEVVGVVSWRRADAENVGFAIPSSEILRMNASLAAIPWSKAATATAAPVSRVENGPLVRTPASAPPPATNSYEALENYLSLQAGEHVSVTVQGAGGDAQFEFQVPKKAAK